MLHFIPHDAPAGVPRLSTLDHTPESFLRPTARTFLQQPMQGGTKLRNIQVLFGPSLASIREVGSMFRTTLWSPLLVLPASSSCCWSGASGRTDLQTLYTTSLYDALLLCPRSVAGSSSFSVSRRALSCFPFRRHRTLIRSPSWWPTTGTYTSGVTIRCALRHNPSSNSNVFQSLHLSNCEVIVFVGYPTLSLTAQGLIICGS